MDHLRISGTEPSSVILRKNGKICLNGAKTSWSQRGWCIKPTKVLFQTILTRKILMLSNATNQTKLIVELGYMCPRGLTGPPALTLTKKLKYKQILLPRCIHHFKSDEINNIDHMRISGTEASSVILSQKKEFLVLYTWSSWPQLNITSETFSCLIPLTCFHALHGQMPAINKPPTKCVKL